LLPFLAVSCFFAHGISSSLIHPRAFALAVTLISDLMAAHFFFLVTDEGSWLDIGTSISHFVIAEATAAFLSLLLYASGLLLGGRQPLNYSGKKWAD